MLASLCLSTALLPWLSTAGQVPLGSKRSTPFTPDFDKLVPRTLEKYHTPGFTVAVVDGEETHSKVCCVSLCSVGGCLQPYAWSYLFEEIA